MAHETYIWSLSKSSTAYTRIHWWNAILVPKQMECFQSVCEWRYIYCRMCKVEWTTDRQDKRAREQERVRWYAKKCMKEAQIRNW